jgi:hypothetical protein
MGQHSFIHSITQLVFPLLSIQFLHRDLKLGHKTPLPLQPRTLPLTHKQ